MFLIRRPGLGLQMMVICFIIACQAAAFLLPPPRAVPPRAGTGVALPRPSRLTMSAEAPKAEPAPASLPKRVELKGLRSERFRHPLDEQATRRLKMLPGLEWVVRRFLRVVEEAVYLDNIGSAVLVGPGQMSSIYSSVVEACRILDVQTVPEVYVRQNPVPNAYCLAFQGRKPFIMLHTSIVDLLTPAEAVIAHELGHIKCEHGVWTTAANGLALGLYNLGGVVGQALAMQVQGLLLAWQRSAEFSCDRAALLVAQDVDVVVSVMLKLVGGSRAVSSELSPQEFLKQARSYEKAKGSPLGRMLQDQMEASLTHPLPVVRAQELERWFQSPEYRGIISRAAASSSVSPAVSGGSS